MNAFFTRHVSDLTFTLPPLRSGLLFRSVLLPDCPEQAIEEKNICLALDNFYRDQTWRLDRRRIAHSELLLPPDETVAFRSVNFCSNRVHSWL